jgi:hypothetical protein
MAGGGAAPGPAAASVPAGECSAQAASDMSAVNAKKLQVVLAMLSLLVDVVGGRLHWRIAATADP